MNQEQAIKHWLEQVVIGLNLCPFARQPYLKESVRVIYESASCHKKITETLLEELKLIDSATEAEIETSLIVLPNALPSFEEYLDFFDECNQMLVSHDYEGVYQLASFHPEYIFAGEEFEERSNATNRSPYPIIHIIRESGIDRAVAAHKNTDLIPDNNIRTLNELSDTEFASLFYWLCPEK